MRSSCAFLATILLCLSPAVGRAETPAIATAQSLFDEARALLEAGAVHSACATFAESQRLDPAGGTLLNLALCHEREGRIATAHAEFEAAIAQAIHDDRRDREAIAREHFEALGPRLPRLVVVVSSIPNLDLSLDGASLSATSRAAPFVVDPGVHTVSARAPGRRETSVQVHADEGRTATAAIPDLPLEPGSEKPTAVEAPAAVEGRAAEKEHGVQHWAGVAGIVAGGTAMTIGVGLFVITPALAAGNSSSCYADGKSVPDCEATYDRVRDKNFRTSAIVAGAGAVVALAGLVLLVTAPPGEARAASAHVRVGVGSVELAGTF